MLRSRDLKIGAIITFGCLLFSLGLGYSYAHGWDLTKGVWPLLLTIILTLVATVVLELVGGPAKVRATPSVGKTAEYRDSATKPRAATIGAFDVLAAPFHALLFVLVVILELTHSILLRARRPQRIEVMKAPHGAHS